MDHGDSHWGVVVYPEKLLLEWFRQKIPTCDVDDIPIDAKLYADHKKVSLPNGRKNQGKRIT